MAVPAKVKERVVAGLKRIGPIITQQRTRDVSEADTVTLVKDCLADVFGFDKYAELTSEHAIRGTYCDLAVRIGEKLALLVEVKAAGTELDDRHVKQAVDYATNQGVEWVILTNGSAWRMYQILFTKPIDKRLLTEIDMTTIDPRKEAAIEMLYLFTREGFLKGAHVELRDRQDATCRYTLAALLLHNDSVMSTLRRELRRVVDVLVDEEEIRKALRAEVLKRDALEGPQADSAARRVNRLEKPKKSRAESSAEPDAPAAAAAPAAPAPEAPTTALPPTVAATPAVLPEPA